MSPLIIALWTTVWAQNSGEVHWVVPLKDGRTIYTFTEKRRLEQSIIQVERDEPWLPEDQRMVRFRITDIDGEPREESPSVREARIARGYRENGFVRLETPYGVQWVPQREKDLADRARAMAAEAEAQYRAASETPAPEAVEAGGPGFFTLWGAHLAILGAATALIALVVWGLLIRE